MGNVLIHHMAELGGPGTDGVRHNLSRDELTCLMVEVWARLMLAQTLLSELLGAESAIEVEGSADES